MERSIGAAPEVVMRFADKALRHDRPSSLRREVVLPRRQSYHPSPANWSDEILYFLLVDRFSDGGEDSRPMLDRANLADARPAAADGSAWRWDRWARSGAERWQGGTIRGVASKLGYLKRLGATTLWLSPVFKQRGHLDSYHGYGIQDLLDVDPRFGTRADLVALVDAAHTSGLRVILDVIFNHSGENWSYPEGTPGGRDTPHYTAGRYAFGEWRTASGDLDPQISAPDDGVWPQELQDPESYTRAGSGSLGAGDISDPEAEHKRSDFITLRDFRLTRHGLLSDLAGCYKYWIALTDCDGFRIDTLKHVSLEEARNFCGTVKEFAANLGKQDFLLAGEIAGGDYNQDRYLDVLERNLNAALDIGEMRAALSGVAKGLQAPSSYFGAFDPGRAVMGSHRNLGNRHVSILDDHDHVFGPKVRFSADAATERQVVAGVALQLFTLGIPCIYYGTEQALGGPEPGERHWLPDWERSDRYLREAMFGPEHPKRQGRNGIPAGAAGQDPELPGFGPFGTAGRHCFDETHPAFRRIALLAEIRAAFPALRHGRQYPRPVSFLGSAFDQHGPGEIVAWSRILDDEEVVCVLNAHGTELRGGDVLVDAELNPEGSAMTVVAATAEADGDAPSPWLAAALVVSRAPDGKAFVSIRDLPPSEVVLLSNHPSAEAGDVVRR